MGFTESEAVDLYHLLLETLRKKGAISTPTSVDARDERFAKLNANYLLLWSAIRWAADNGYHTVDLGRSDLEQTQLRGFKDGWGARETVLPYSRIATAAVRVSSRRMEGTMAKVIRNSAPCGQE